MLSVNRSFSNLWIAQSVSQFGTLVGSSALSFLAIATLNATPWQVTALGTVEHLAGIIGAVVATITTDRLRRRPLMIAADIGRAILTMAIPLLAVTALLAFEHLLLIASLVGILSVVFNVACGAYLPTIVDEDHLVDANARLSASASVAEVAGFGIAGWLVQWLTAPIAIAVDSLSFIVSAIALGRISVPEPIPDLTMREAPVTGHVRTAINDARLGFDIIRTNPVLLGQFGAFVVDAVAGGLARVTIVIYMIRGIGFEPGILASMWAVGGLTSLAGAFLTRHAVTRFGAGPTMVVGLIGTGLGTLLIPLATAPTLVGAILLVLNQVVVDPCATAYQITADSLRQSLVPNQFLGRVASVTHLVTATGTVVGMLLGGYVMDAAGLRAGVTLCGIVALLGAIVLALSPAGRVGPVTIITD